MKDAFRLQELDPRRLGKLFDQAFVENGFDEDGDLVVLEDFEVVVRVFVEQDLLRYEASFGSGAPHLDVLSFVNAFNRETNMVKAYVRDDKDDDGDWVVTFEHDIKVYPKESLSAATIVRAARDFQGAVHHGIEAVDDGTVFPTNDED
ncbi:MAG: YbjN domain-containing protein [Armatimonadota bacterium]